MALVSYLKWLGVAVVVLAAVVMLVFGGAPVFSFAMGAFPIFAGATLLFTLAGWRLARAAEGAERLAHQATRRWVLVGLILPLLAFAVTSPFLAYFFFGGPIVMWGVPSLALLGGAAVLDWRAARPGRRRSPGVCDGRPTSWPHCW
jgi:hypothetical protein